MIQEYVQNGDLLAKIKNFSKTPYTEDQIRKYFRQLLSAVWYCHEEVNIFHRDIKPDNILLDNNDNIKLADFGVSNQFGSKRRKQNKEDEFLEGNAGSDCYFSPEACGANKYSGKMADLWACAVTLYQMVFLKLPFNAKNR